MTELRKLPRSAVRGWRVWIEWRDDDAGFGASAELVNISPAGALALSPVPPRVGQRVTLCVEDLEPPARFGAVVVATQACQQGHRVHLELRVPCPAAVFEAVIVERVTPRPLMGILLE